MSITALPTDQALDMVNDATEITALRDMAAELDVSFSGNTGIDTLKRKIVAKLESLQPAEGILEEAPEDLPTQDAASILMEGAEEEIQVAKTVSKPAGPSVAEMLEMNPTEIEDPVFRRQVIRAQALRLRRVAIQNNDPSEADLPATIVTVLNKYLGKVSKLIPFGEGSEGGYHIPQVIYDHLKAQKFVLRRKKKSSGMGVAQYSNHMISKYTITDLPDLTPAELKSLGARQQATQAIG